MTTIGRMLCAALLIAATPLSTGAWVVTPELGYGIGVTLTAAGDVLSVGESAGADIFDFSVRLQSRADGSDVWHYQLDGSGPDIGGSFNDYAGDVAIDGNGDVIAAGQIRNSGTNLDLHVVKLTPAGVPIWSQTLDSPSHLNESYSDLALHPGGDLAVAGTFGVAGGVGGPPQTYYFSVARLAGATGAVLWQHDVPGTPISRAAVVHWDAAGNLLAAGDLSTSPTGSEMLAVKLDGATGAELWHTQLSGGNAPVDDNAYVAALDVAGDFYVGGLSSTETGDGFTVFKVAGATGAVLWQYDHVSTESGAFATLLVTDGAGHVYAGGYVDGTFVLVKLDAASGAPLWSRRIPKAQYAAAAFDPAGDLVLAGSQGYRFSLQKIRALDGHKAWRRLLRGNGYNGGYATDVAIDASGAVFGVGGHVSPIPPGKVNGYPSYTVLRACGKNGRVNRTDNCP